MPTIVGHHGGLTDRLRAQWPWVIPIPEDLDAKEVGPLLCGGVTVFGPLQQFGIKPTDRVGIVGIGGLGHMALKFAAAWGCEVTAFTSSGGKADEARSFGAQHVVNSRDAGQIAAIAGTLNLVLVTVNVPLDWKALTTTLRPKGRLHFVGAVLEPVPVTVMDNHHEPAQHIRVPQWIADDDGDHAGVRGPPSNTAADRAFPDRAGERGARSSPRRQSPLPDCPRHVRTPNRHPDMTSCEEIVRLKNGSRLLPGGGSRGAPSKSVPARDAQCRRSIGGGNVDLRIFPSGGRG